MALSEIAAGLELTAEQRDRGVATADGTGASLAERLAPYAGALPCDQPAAAAVVEAYAEGASVGRAAAVADAMQQASREAGIEAARFVTRADDGGLRRGGCAGRTDA